jgi:hypothetical protein
MKKSKEEIINGFYDAMNMLSENICQYGIMLNEDPDKKFTQALYGPPYSTEEFIKELKYQTNQLEEYEKGIRN